MDVYKGISGMSVIDYIIANEKASEEILVIRVGKREGIMCH